LGPGAYPARVWFAAGLACALVASMADASAARAAGTCTEADTRSSQLTQGEARRAVRCLINEERAGRRSLRLNRTLNRAALKHSRRMREHTCLKHRCLGEPALRQRLRRYLRRARRTRYAEVIAVNVAAATPRDVVRQWITSAPHRTLILGRYKHLGVGLATGQGRAWYTVDLGWKR
jgi:uncharacterized protein YkwD